jgi:hypothetical protein
MKRRFAGNSQPGRRGHGLESSPNLAKGASEGDEIFRFSHVQVVCISVREDLLGHIRVDVIARDRLFVAGATIQDKFCPILLGCVAKDTSPLTMQQFTTSGRTCASVGEVGTLVDVALGTTGALFAETINAE